jgi:spore germination cell wall hydrolase CwlJ-like protein
MFVLAVVLLLFVDNADAATKLQKTYAAQLKCMKDVIYFEARGEGYAGKAAVANVVLNRAKSTAYPRDVCAVVYQNRQFSWTIDKSKHGVRVKHGKDIEAVASLALANLLKDNTGGATHFHTVDILPYWASSLYNTVTIGRHIFYKQPKGKTS